MERRYAVAKEIVGEDIRNIRMMLGLSRREFADFTGVSPRTVEYWEKSEKPVTGPIVPLCQMLFENKGIPERLELPGQPYPLRLIYYYRTMPCTLIDVDEVNQTVKIVNYTDKLQYRAFGPIENPDYQEYVEFLKSRCFPETRDKIKLELARLQLPFYDPLLIIEKTGGRMAEDQFHVVICRK